MKQERIRRQKQKQTTSLQTRPDEPLALVPGGRDPGATDVLATTDALLAAIDTALGA